MLAALQGDPLLAVTLGAALTVAAYSSLAIVMLTATLAAGGSLALPGALALVPGANLGSGLLALLTTARADAPTRRVPLGNLLFKGVGVSLALLSLRWLMPVLEAAGQPAALVVGFHLGFNVFVALLFVAFTRRVAALVERLLPVPPAQEPAARASHLDPAALATPSLALSCAAREVMHQADVVERILQDLEEKNIQQGRRFSAQGQAEI